MDEAPKQARIALCNELSEEGPLEVSITEHARLGWVSEVYALLTTAWQRYLDVILGVLLVVAGAGKADRLLNDTSFARTIGFPRELLFGVAAVELGLGCWMLVGLCRRKTRWLALAWFTCLAAAALAELVSGAPSCPCFGVFHSHPGYMLVVDAGAIAALLLWSPVCSSKVRRALFCISLLLATILLPRPSLFSSHPVSRGINFGELAKGGMKHR